MLVDVKRRGIDSTVESAAQAGVPLTLTIDDAFSLWRSANSKPGWSASTRAAAPRL